MSSFKLLVFLFILSIVFAARIKKNKNSQVGTGTEKGPADWARCIPESEGFYEQAPTCYFRCVKATYAHTWWKKLKCLNKCCICTKGCLNQCKLNKEDPLFSETEFWKKTCVNSCCGLSAGWDTLYR